MWEKVVKLGLSVRHLAAGPGSIPCAWASLMEPMPHGGMPFSAYMWGGEGVVFFPAPT